MIIRINCGKPSWMGIVIALSLLLKLHFYFAIIMSTQNGLSYLHELFSFLVLQPENAAQPIERLWIFIAIKNKFLATPNAVQQNIVFHQLPAAQSVVIAERRFLFVWIKPSGQAPGTS